MFKIGDLIRMRRAMKDFEKQLSDPTRQAELLAAVAAIPGDTDAIAVGGADQITQLERLAALRRNGTLTDAESEQEKAPEVRGSRAPRATSVARVPCV